MDDLNYHHLRYFREVAREGALNRAAERLNLSQSALSIQIKTLEERLGHRLFDRVGRRLALTEVGRIVLDHADRIFGAGEELMATLRLSGAPSSPLRVGAISTLSRNFQLQFLRPLLRRGDADIMLRAGDEAVLFDALASLALDVVLTTAPPASTAGRDYISHRIAEQPVHLHGAPHRLHYPTLRALLAQEPLIAPTQSTIRSGFTRVTAMLDVTPRIVAEVDDMTMLRLLVREDFGLALAPSVVVADEITSGAIQTAPFDLAIAETFYAVTLRRQFPHPLLKELIRPAQNAETNV